MVSLFLGVSLVILCLPRDGPGLGTLSINAWEPEGEAHSRHAGILDLVKTPAMRLASFNPS